MPSTSERQRRAMEAAAQGKSNLGIPKKVGAEYRAADRAKARAAKKKGYKRKLPETAPVKKKRAKPTKTWSSQNRVRAKARRR